MGYLFIGKYPFYSYELFVDTPQVFDAYQFFSEDNTPLPAQELQFENFSDGGPPADVGRKPFSYYIWNKVFSKDDFEPIAQDYFKKNPSKNLIKVKRLLLGTLENGTFGVKDQQEWILKKFTQQ